MICPKCYQEILRGEKVRAVSGITEVDSKGQVFLTEGFFNNLTVFHLGCYEYPLILGKDKISLFIKEITRLDSRIDHQKLLKFAKENQTMKIADMVQRWFSI